MQRPNPKSIFFIRPVGIGLRSIPPYGLLSLQAYLGQYNIDSYIFDREVKKRLPDLKKTMEQQSVSVVGISALTCQLQDAQYLVRKIRQWFDSKVIIVAGGQHFTVKPEDALEVGCDYVIKGDGEISLSECLIDGFPNQKIIERKLLSNLDEIPQIKMSNLQPFIFKESHGSKGFYTILTSRGCPYRCNFCLGINQRSTKIRNHSIEYFVEYVKNVHETFGIKTFFIPDDIFILNPARVIKFCTLIKETFDTKLRFHCFIHAGLGSPELFAIMKAAGFFRVSMGAEHGNDQILEVCGKKVTVADIEKTCSIVHGQGLELSLSFILGNITETDTTITETVDFAIYLHKKYNTLSWFSFMQPLPGAPVYDVAEEYGVYLQKKHTWHNTDLIYLPFGVSQKHILKERKRGFRFANPINSRSLFHKIIKKLNQICLFK